MCHELSSEKDFIYQNSSLSLRKFTAKQHHQVNFTKIGSGLGPRIDPDLASATFASCFCPFFKTFQESDRSPALKNITR